MKAIMVFGGSVPSRQAGESGKSVAPLERQAVIDPIHQGEQQVNLSAFQRAVPVRQFANRQGLRLFLHTQSDDISALVPRMPAKNQPNVFGPYAGVGV